MSQWSNPLRGTNEYASTFSYVEECLTDEGLEYCFLHYSNFKEVEDEEFHALRKEFVDACNKLSEYVYVKSREEGILLAED